MNPYDTLGIPRNSAKDVVKKKYRDIAISCHPDKLINIEDEDEKSKRIHKFKEASIAYDTIINDKFIYNEEDTCFDDWYEIWNTFFDKENTTDILKDVFFDVADSFINKDIKPRSYYNPRNNKKHLHEINLEISMIELKNNAKKKLRLILVDIEEPIFVDVYCNSFPKVVKEYISDDDIEHEIIIHMTIKTDANYEYIINENKTIDLITSVNINLHEHLIGVMKEMIYIDNSKIQVQIDRFTNNYVKVNDHGLNGGSLFVNVFVDKVEKESWDILSENDKSNMVRISNLLSKTI